MHVCHTQQEAILSIGSAMTALEFCGAVDHGLRLALPCVEHSLVLLLDVESNELAYFESDSCFHLMPKSGVVWEAVRRRTTESLRTGIPENDPIRSLLPTLKTVERDHIGWERGDWGGEIGEKARLGRGDWGVGSRVDPLGCGLLIHFNYTVVTSLIKNKEMFFPLLTTHRHTLSIVVLSPIVEKKQHRVIALMLAVCTEPTLMHNEKLKWLEKNVLVAASRVLKHMVAERDRIRAEDMLRVCGDLIDLDTASLTIKILKHLKFIMEAEMCLLFIIDDATSELVCQVFDENSLDTEIRKPVRVASLSF